MHINPSVDKIEKKIAGLTCRHKKSTTITPKGPPINQESTQAKEFVEGKRPTRIG